VAANLLLWEYLSGGGMAKESVPSSLLCEGIAMLRAIASDSAVVGFSLIIPLDSRFAWMEDWLPPAKIIQIHPNDNLTEILQQQATFAGSFFIVAPEYDDILYKFTISLEECAQNLGCSGDFIHIFGNKWETWQYLAARGTPMPVTGQLQDEITNDLLLNLDQNAEESRFVIKPTSGAGAGGIFTCSIQEFNDPSFRKLLAKVIGGQPHIIQEFVPGRAFSANFVVVDGLICPLCVNEQLIHLSSTITVDSSYQGGVSPAPSILQWMPPESLENHLQELIQALPSPQSGFFGVDFTCDEGGHFHVIEVNARLTTSYVALSSVLGGNPANFLLGEPVPPLLATIAHPAKIVYYRKLFYTVNSAPIVRANGNLSALGTPAELPEFYACPPVVDFQGNLSAFIKVVGANCRDVRHSYRTAQRHFQRLKI
jgi:predicted ATP-grasp superfamily ATP-dependent carboligase